jgi:hypothetical protein
VVRTAAVGDLSPCFQLLAPIKVACPASGLGILERVECFPRIEASLAQLRHRDASVDRIEAGGLGVFLGLLKWAYSHAVRFQLMNVMNRVEKHVLELTKLDRVFEFCSVEDMLQLLHFAAATAPPSVDQAKQGIVKDNCKYLV